MRFLPGWRRDAIIEIYRFCRAVDDIADDPRLSRTDKLRDLETWRTAIDLMMRGRAPLHLQRLADAVGTFGLERRDFAAVIDGMEMDVLLSMCAPSAVALDLYCDRVASAVGRLCVKVFGIKGKLGIELAHHLGRALQLTNILRDLDEDAEQGRLYLAAEWLMAEDVPLDDVSTALAHPRFSRACARAVDLAREHFARSHEVMQALPSHQVRSPRLMAGVYEALLGRLETRGFAAPREKIRLSRWRLLLIVLRHGLA
jgi:phytoene synthase